MPTAAVVGALTIDRVLEHGRVVEKPGGPPLYAGVALAALGFKVRVVSVVGEDYPREALEYLESHGVDVSLVIRSRRSPTVRFTLVYEDGERKLRATKPPNKIPVRLVEELGRCDVVLVSPVLGEASQALLAAARRNSKLLGADLQGFVRKLRGDGVVVLKPRSEAYAAMVAADVVHVEETEARAMVGGVRPGVAAAELALRSRSLLALTLGPRGSILASRKGPGYALWIGAYVPERKGEPDPTGAGDVYTAALLAAINMGYEYKQALAFATVAAGIEVWEKVFPGRKAVASRLKEALNALSAFKFYRSPEEYAAIALQLR